MKHRYSCAAIVVLLGAQSLQAQWIQSNGPYGAHVLCFAANGSNLGTTWTRFNGGLTNTAVEALAMSRSNLFAGIYSGVFLSTDNGTTWTAVNTGLVKSPVYALIADGSKLLAGTAVWDGRDQSGTAVSSGIYIYSLHVGESIQSRKMAFVQ